MLFIAFNSPNLVHQHWKEKKTTKSPNNFDLDSRVGGEGKSAYERGGDGRRKFWIKPLKETNLGVAPTFFWPVKAIILDFYYMNRVNNTNWKYIIFWYFFECNPKRDLYG